MRMTSAQLQEYLSKHAAKSSTPAHVPQSESAIHRDILERCKDNGFIVFHGSMAHKTFRTPGEPDFVILITQGRTLLVECKTKTGKLSPDQQAIAAWAEKLGHKIHVVRSVEEFEALIK